MYVKYKNIDKSFLLSVILHAVILLIFSSTWLQKLPTTKQNKQAIHIDVKLINKIDPIQSQINQPQERKDTVKKIATAKKVFLHEKNTTVEKVFEKVRNKPAVKKTIVKKASKKVVSKKVNAKLSMREQVGGSKKNKPVKNIDQKLKQTKIENNKKIKQANSTKLAKEKEEKSKMALAKQQQDASDLEIATKTLLDHLSQFLLQPNGQFDEWQTLLEIKLDEKGQVSNVKVLRSSGSTQFDRVAINTVYKAQPLPLPSNKRVREKFMHFTLNVSPKH